MSLWGLVLLGLFLFLGLSRKHASNGIALSVCLTALIIVGVMAKTIR